jgi:alpha-galactosidase
LRNPTFAFVCLLFVSLAFAPLARSAETELKNAVVVVKISSADGSYAIGLAGKNSPILQAVIAAEVDHQWIRSDKYPKREIAVSPFVDDLGRGTQATVTFSGLPNQPDASYTIRLYENEPYGEIEVQLQNHTQRSFQVESIRSVEAMGSSILDLEANAEAGRVLSDSFSEDWPPLQIYDLGKAPHGMHRAVGSQLIYNRQSKQSIFFGALSSDRLLTIFHLKTQTGSKGPSIASFNAESTGTTEIQSTEEDSGMRGAPKENLVELNLPLAAGASMSAERLMFAAGADYHAQLENYGSAIKTLHHSRIPEENMMGWWSWTAFYMKITEGNTFTNALWLAQHLLDLGYNWFHFDFGYGYARGDYAVPNASKFPHGMRPLTQRIAQLGLNIGIWTAPFEVGGFSSIYQQHKDWLVHNAHGDPIQITTDEEVRNERVYVLDTTNPGAQEFLRQTYHTLVREWEVKYIKLDFMDNTAIEGYYFRPHTTALEAQRMGLQAIREAVGNDVLLDKDGSPMLNTVGLVDDGRVSQDTGHSFERSKEAASGIAARYYMHRNFFINDPDAFTVSRQLIEERQLEKPLTLDEAEVSIALAAVSGGMYEIGDDLPTLGVDADRVALVKNPDLIQMAKLGRASIPIDLLSYSADDEMPSVFVLHEDARQSMLAVFNWTEQSRSHQLLLSDLGLSAHNYDCKNVLRPSASLACDGTSIRLEQPAHSVRVIKVIDPSIPAAAPSVTVHLPDYAKVNEDISLSAIADPASVPALDYHWDFGDGTTQSGRQVHHTYTMQGEFTVQLIVNGVDGISTERKAQISVKGEAALPPPSRYEGAD